MDVFLPESVACANQEVRTLEQLNSNTYFMGLFDGHGGPETSKYLRENAQDAIGKRGF